MSIKKMLLMIVSMTLSYGIILFFVQDLDWIRTFIGIAAPIIASLFIIIQLCRTTRTTKGEQAYFWLLILVGSFFYMCSSLVWLFHLLTTGTVSSTPLSLLLWLLGYLCFFIGIIYRIKAIQDKRSDGQHIFTIVAVVIFAVSFICYFFIEPALTMVEQRLNLPHYIIIYPIAGISILGANTVLFYLSIHLKEKVAIIFLTFGFFTQIIGDALYTYQIMEDKYQVGSYIDVVWLTAMLFIVAGGYFATKQPVELNWKVIHFFTKADTSFPYLIMLSLWLLTLYSYAFQLNALSIGFSLIIATLIIYQLKVVRRHSQLIKQYQTLAYYDPLTGLKNRTSFTEEFEHLLAKAGRFNQPVGLLVLDLDRFKNVNDSLGHQVGDQLLQKAANRLKQLSDQGVEMYRIGGDEFVLILLGRTRKQVSQLADRLRNLFQPSLYMEHHELIITPSIGIAIFPDDAIESKTLFKYADAAMYSAKESGKNDYVFFNQSLNEDLIKKFMIESELKHAINRDQLKLIYQPKVKLSTNSLYGVEALIRWEHPELGLVLPNQFIPIAEETGLIQSIGEWALWQAAKQTLKWQKQGYTDMCVSVNVSAKQIEQQDLVAIIKQIWLDTGLSPSSLELEITESIMQNIKQSAVVLNHLKQLGIKLSIDDFGTGYSSLHILKELPIDTIKIDQSLISTMHDSRSLAIVKTIINLGKNLNMAIVAEGVETQEQAEILISEQCDYGQGYLFSHPIDPKQISDQFLLLKNV